MRKCMKTLHETKEKCKQKTLKTWNKPGSSHPYTQRQLVLERKLKSTCPQVRHFTPNNLSKQDTTFSKHGVMHFYASLEIQGKTANLNLSIKQRRFEFTKTRYRSTT